MSASLRVAALAAVLGLSIPAAAQSSAEADRPLVTFTPA
jgi:hypothetical protein